MDEDSWLKCEREYFVKINSSKIKVPTKEVNNIIKQYNAHLQKSLFGLSPYMAMDLKFTIIKAGGGKVVRTELQSE